MTGQIEHATDMAFSGASSRARRSQRPAAPSLGGVRRQARTVLEGVISFGEPDWFGFFGRHGFVQSETVSTRPEASRVGGRAPLRSKTAPVFRPLGASWREKADQILGHTWLGRRGP